MINTSGTYSVEDTDAGGSCDAVWTGSFDLGTQIRGSGYGFIEVPAGGYTHSHARIDEMEEEEMSRRYVHVLIVDPDERIPVESALLYAGTAYLTDMTDEETFLSLDLGTMLAKHNAVRETILDEEETRKRGKDVYLPPIKIRDLAKRVIVVATF